MNSIKICFPLGRFYPSQVGGPASTVYWHTCALANSGVKTSVITTTVGIADGLVDIDMFIPTDSGTVYYGNGTETNVTTLRRIRDELRSSDIIHLNSLFNIFSIFSFFYARLFLRSKKIIISVRGELSPSALKYGKMRKKAVLLLYRIFSNKIVFHSTAEKETQEIKNVFNCASVVNIPNLMKPAIRLESELKKHQFLFIGRIHPIKAIDKLLAGLVMSKDFKRSDFKLVIAGVHSPSNESYFRKLQEFVESNDLGDKVEFLGHRSGNEKELLYYESYFTFLTSETENFGNVVLESLNQGTPVVASLGTPWSKLEATNSGFHVSNEPDALARKIDEIINLSSESYKMMQKNSKKLIDQEYNVDRRIGDWVKIYARVARGETLTK